MSEKIAIIDCGTNTFHLLVVSLEEPGIKTLAVDRTVVKIGEGGINNKIITPQAVERALTALTGFKEKIDALAVDKIYAFATSAFRNADNGFELKNLIKRKTSINIEIIPGEMEAKLIFYGVNSAITIGNEPALVMDIGGGSVEFIIGSRDTILWSRSFELGAQRLLDMFHNHEPISPQDLSKLDRYLLSELSELLEVMAAYKLKTLIGSSGTFDTLSAIYCEQRGYKFNAKAKEIPFDLEAFKAIYHLLITKNKKERLAIPGMIPMRVDMIVVASALIDFLLRHHTFDEIRVSTYALKEGVLDQILKGQL